MEVSGIFLLSLGRACWNLRVLVAPSLDSAMMDVTPEGWYPKAQFDLALGPAIAAIRDRDPVLERLGEEMMRLWYEAGPGHQLVQDGMGFLRFQAGSEGYRSLARGPVDEVGEFTIVRLDEPAGTATLRSSTPFPRALERGVLLGGVRLAGSVDFVSVRNDEDPDCFEVMVR